MGDKRAQYTLRGNTAHFQYGEVGSYEKYDVPATPDLVAYYNQAVEDGETENSLADTSTQYAVVEAVTSGIKFRLHIKKVVDVEV